MAQIARCMEAARLRMVSPTQRRPRTSACSPIERSNSATIRHCHHQVLTPWRPQQDGGRPPLELGSPQPRRFPGWAGVGAIWRRAFRWCHVWILHRSGKGDRLERLPSTPSAGGDPCDRSGIDQASTCPKNWRCGVICRQLSRILEAALVRLDEAVPDWVTRECSRFR